MRKATVLLAEIMLLSLILGACLDAREIDEWAYIYTIGVDKGISDKLRMTVQIPALKTGTPGGQGGQGSSSGSESEYTVISLDCPSFYSGVSMINTSLSRKLNYTHAKFFMVSEDLAREDIGPLIRAFVRDRQIRRTMHMIVVKGQASEFIQEYDPVVGTAISKTQEGMMAMEGETGFFIDTTFGEFLDDTKSTKRQPIAVLAAVNDFSNFTDVIPAESKDFKSSGDYYAGELPRKGGDKGEYLGAALFDGGRMVGELNGDETRALMMIKGEFERGSIAIPDPLKPELVDTLIIRQQKQPDVKITFRNNEPVIRLHIFLEGDLQALQSDEEYEDPKLKPILEKQVRSILEDHLKKTIEKCQKLGCDVFGFGDTACMQFLTIQEWEAYGWLNHFSKATIESELDFTIRRTGTMIRTNPVKSTEGEE